MNNFESGLYFGIAFLAVMGIVMLVTNIKMYRALKKPDSEQQSKPEVE